MSYYTISQSLKTILETVRDGGGNRLASIYDTQVPTSPTYPYATLSTGEATEESLDTATNTTLYRFTIRAVNVAEDKVTTETTMRKLADDILAELRKRANQTLGGTVDRFLPFTLSWGWENGSTVPNRYFEIRLEILKHFSID
jgi:hypothetical protein